MFEGSVRYVRAVRAAGLATAVVSSSANTVDVLAAAGIADLFDVRIDGVVARDRAWRASRRRTRSWPAPLRSASPRPTPRCSRMHSPA